MVKVMNLQRTSEASCGSSLQGQFLAEVEIQVKKGVTSLNKTSSKYKLVYNGLIWEATGIHKHFSGFSVGFSINEEGYLLPTVAQKITC